MKIGYLGPPGSFSHDAARQCSAGFGGKAEYIALPEFAAIFDAVEKGELEHGIVPVENSTHGAVAVVMDLLRKLRRGTVCGELVIDIEHCLVAKAAALANIRTVYSHEQALAQCRDYFGNYPAIALIACASTSQACQLARAGGGACGAVAGRTAAKLYELPVLAGSIQDNALNQTRFFLIGRRSPEPTGRDKTSVVFAFQADRPGNLATVLQAYAGRGINLTRVESRPAKHSMGDYIFYIDFLGHKQDKVCADALTAVGRQVAWLKILGSYPVNGGRGGEATCYGI